MTPNRSAAWFTRVAWLGVVVNLAFAVPALLTPGAFAATLGLDGRAGGAAVWLPNAGMLLVVLSGFHALAAADPLAALAFARWAVAGRLLAAAFWAWLAWGHGPPGVLWYFFAADATLGLLGGWLLARALAVEPPPVARPWRRGLYDRAYGGFFSWLERRMGVRWYDVWLPLLGSVATGGLRRELRAHNLHASPRDVPDGEAERGRPDPTLAPHALGPWDPAYRAARAPDGSYNDLADPAMGMNAMQFGRNFAPAETRPVVPPAGDPDRGVPNPRDVSIRLLARPRGAGGEPVFTPATSLNLLAAAWIQFQNHGWFAHRLPRLAPDPRTGALVPVHPETGEPIPFDEAADFIRVPFTDPSHPDNVEWTRLTGQTEMRVHRSVPDPTRRRDAPYPPTFRTTEAHWWGASQLYGPRADLQRRLRSFEGGRLTVVTRQFLGAPETLLPLDPAPGPHAPGKELGVDLTGFNDNYWVGTSILHTLFVKEHNYLCGALAAEYKNDLSGMTDAARDEWLFGKARLVVAALMAKIHTLEWTPGILNHPTLHTDMKSNWWGVLGRWLKVHVGRVSANEGVSGIVASQAEHHAAPYSLTEDFVAVYRLHPLVPDSIVVREVTPTGLPVAPVAFADLQGANTRQAVLDRGVANWLYSFGTQHPGAIRLRNYPHALRRLCRGGGEFLDLATRDVVRDRERGVPLYNRFRELVRMRPIRSYDELVGHWEDPAERADLLATLRDLYGTTADGRDNVDGIDLLVGLLGEKLPPGFGFSDTAFRIFILMASRRLKSDRFFTDDFRPEVYTRLGTDWVNSQTMTALIERHYPELRGIVRPGDNPFAPWTGG